MTIHQRHQPGHQSDWTRHSGETCRSDRVRRICLVRRTCLILRTDRIRRTDQDHPSIREGRAST